MARVVSFSCLNPIQFAEANRIQPAQYNARYFDEGWNYSKTIKDYEDGKSFLHKVRFNDLISLQVLAGPYTDPIMLPDPPNLYLLDCNNNIVNEVTGYIDATEVYNLSSYTLPDGTDINATIFQYNLQLASYFTTVENRQGHYRLMLRTVFDDGEHMDHYSEWIDLKIAHPGTVLLQYHNSINDLDTNFEQLHPRFSMRVEGDIHSYEPGATVTGYAAQTEVFTQLSSHPYDTYKFTAINAPDFLLKRLNHVFSCDSLMVDGKVFSRDDGAKWEVQRPERHPLKGLTVQLRSGRNTHSQATVSKRTYFEWAGYGLPKFYHRPQLNNFIGQLIILRENVVLEDLADAEAFASDLTTEASGYGLSGTFGYEGDRLYYENGAAENFFAGLDKVMSGLMHINITTPSANTPFFFTTKGGYMGIDWGDGAILNYYVPPTGVYSPQHTYAVAGNYNIRVFHDGWASGTAQITIQQQQVVPPTRMVTNITGLAPASLQVFSLTYANLDSSFNLAFLQNTWGNLKQLIVEDCNMVHPFTGSLFTYGTAPKWANLKLLDFRNNHISTTGVNAVMDEFAGGAYIGFIMGAAPPYRFKIEGQSPSAPPTLPRGSYSALTITPGGWTVTKD